jgi:hypothetical protein
MGASRRRENYTQAQIEQAVEAMMMRLSTGHGFDAAAARRVAQLIGPYVNDANTGIPPGGALIGNQAFERMVLEKAQVAALASNDPNTIAEALKRAREANITSSAFAAAQSFLHTAFGSAAMPGKGGEGGDGDRTTSSAAYSRELSGGSYGALLKEGYSRAQLDQAMSYAQTVGWTDKDSIRMFADTGPAGGALAKTFEEARKRGDQDGMARAKQEAKEHEDNAKTDKERKGWHGLREKFDKLNAATPSTKIKTATEQAAPTAEETAQQRNILEGLRKNRAAHGPSPK